MNPSPLTIGEESPLSETSSYWQRLKQMEADSYRRYSVDELYERAYMRFRYLSRDARMSERYRGLFRILAQYMALDADCPLDLSKGLILTGGIGCGKTTLFRCFDLTHPMMSREVGLSTHNILPYSLVSCNRVARAYATDGVQTLYPYFKGNWMFDDLGTESTSKYYGQSMDVMGEILLERYDSYRKYRTYITTNLTHKQISGLYGARIASRLTEMCNWIEMGENHDYRR